MDSNHQSGHHVACFAVNTTLPAVASSIAIWGLATLFAFISQHLTFGKHVRYQLFHMYLLCFKYLLNKMVGISMLCPTPVACY